MIEYITNIPVEKLKPFPDHPFQVRDDDSMRETVESIKTYGVLQPAIVRPSKDGDYEILSGHRRKRADVAQLAEQLICNQQVIGSSPIIGF